MNQKALSNILVLRLMQFKREKKLSDQQIAEMAGVKKKDVIDMFAMEEIPAFGTFLAVSRAMDLNINIVKNDVGKY